METYVHYGNISLNSAYHTNVSDKIAEKIKTPTLCSVTFLWKSFRLLDNVKKYGGDGHATYDNII